MTSYKSAFMIARTMALGACLSVVVLAGCSKRDPYLSNNGATFYVDTVTPTFTSDGQSNGFVSRKFINFTACVKDNALTAAIMNLHFQIKAGDVTVTKVTDERGCLVWQELFSYDGTDDEKQILLNRSITAIEGHSGTELVQIAYDPWDPADKNAFLKREAGRSAQAVPIEYAAGGPITRKNADTKEDYTVTVDIRGTLQSSNLKKSDITSLRLKDEGRDFTQYEVDQELNLTTARKYLLNFTAGVIRTTFAKGTGSENINSGHFKIYFALLKEGFDANKSLDASFAPFIVSANQTDTEAHLGRFVQEAVVKFDNVVALASRMTGVLTLVSTDEGNHFAETSFEGVLSPITGGDQEIDFIPSENLNARQLLEIQTSYKSQQKVMRALDAFALKSGFKAMTTTDAPVQAPSTSKFLKGLQSPAVQNFPLFATFKKMRAGQKLSASEQSLFGEALCYKYFDGIYDATLFKNALDECKAQPEQMINSTIRDFVEQVNNPVPAHIGGPVQESMTVAAGIDFSEAKTHAKGSTTTLTKGVSIGIDGEIGAGIGWPPIGGPAKPGPGKPSILTPVSAKISGSLGGKFSYGKDWFTTDGVVASNDDVTKVSVNRAITVNAEGFAFELDVTTRPCLLVMPTQQMEALLAKTDTANKHPAGRYFCGEQATRNSHYREIYYFLNEATDSASSPLGDNLSSNDNPWRLFIRGAPTFSLFESVLSQKNIKLTLNKMPDDELRNQLNSFYTTQEFPGMLMPTTAQ